MTSLGLRNMVCLRLILIIIKITERHNEQFYNNKSLMFNKEKNIMYLSLNISGAPRQFRGRFRPCRMVSMNRSQFAEPKLKCWTNSYKSDLRLTNIQKQSNCSYIFHFNLITTVANCQTTLHVKTSVNTWLKQLFLKDTNKTTILSHLSRMPSQVYTL